MSGHLYPPENHKAGLFARLSFCGTGSDSVVWTVDPGCRNLKNSQLPPRPLAHRPRLVTHPLKSHRVPPCVVANNPRPACYMTMARFSNSYCSTGRAHPAISTRPAASKAALGETP